MDFAQSCHRGIVSLLDARVAHLQAEEERNRRSNYADIAKWRRLEAEHLLQKIKELAP